MLLRYCGPLGLDFVDSAIRSRLLKQPLRKRPWPSRFRVLGFRFYKGLGFRPFWGSFLQF